MTSATSYRASDFITTIGVDTHIAYTDGGYANCSNIAADLDYLGIGNVRDGISDGAFGSASLASYIKLAQQGEKFTINPIDGSVVDDASLVTRLELVQRLEAAVPGCVTAIEGANEINNWPVTFDGQTGLEGAVAMQRALYSAVHGNAALAGVAVDYFTGYGVGSDVGPDPSQQAGLADYDTQHPYPRNSNAPAGAVAPDNAAINEQPSQTGALVFTETGYSSKGGTWGATDQAVQAKYTLDLLLDDMKNGVAKTYLYELMDAYAPGSRQGDDGWGLFDYQKVAKPVATAIHDLTSILSDTGANAATFHLGTFSPTFAGLPATGQSLVLQKSSGVTDLVVWAEPLIWNPATGTEIAAPSCNVTVALGGLYSTVRVYDPLIGTTALQTLSNASSVQIALTDHPMIVEVGSLVPVPSVVITSETLAHDAGTSATDRITSDGHVMLTGSVGGAAGTIVALYDGDTALGDASIGPAGSWSFATILSNGTHALHAVATDPAGRIATSMTAAPVTIMTGAPAAPHLASDGQAVSLSGGFSAGDTTDIQETTYRSTDEVVFTVTAGGGTLQIVDPDDGDAVVGEATLSGNYANGVFTLTSDGAAGTTLGFAVAPSLGLVAGDVEQSSFNITGQAYTGAVRVTDASGELVAARYTGVTGQGYQAFEADYSNGTNTQTQYFYTGITGQPYTTETLTVNAAGQQTAVAFGGFASAPYASYEHDYDGGLFAGSTFTYTAVPAGATYSSYETDYDVANSYLGTKFFTTNITGQIYTGEEVDTDPTGTTSRVLLTGFIGQPYQTLELDDTGGGYLGYKTFASNITGQSYTGLEEDVTAAGQLTKVVYTGLKSTPYTTLEQDYTGGALSSSTFTFKAAAGQTYSSFAVTQNAAGTQLSETVNNTNGSHTLVGSANNLIFESIGNDKIKGGGSGETFDFSTVFGHDTIIDFSGHTTGTGHDTIALSTADFGSFAAVMASAQNVNGGVAFTGKSGSQITLQGLDKTTLAGLAADFMFQN